MNSDKVTQIRKIMELKSTDELLRIYKEHNQDEWSSEAFEAIRHALSSRPEVIPSLEVTPDPVIIDENKHDKKLIEQFPAKKISGVFRREQWTIQLMSNQAYFVQASGDSQFTLPRNESRKNISFSSS